ncbi:hypothetical protein KPH14_012565 [Odynerus spinipes]|uniref:RNA-directed DNA polymerase from mobile element jockey n=1 Tax=Odynerus spinipes TaxID=1348599 RepID=A0AAD9REZ1_9HYME|nr:hypothetical protein KPH14_012565 [Odynerus spinipes]
MSVEDQAETMANYLQKVFTNEPHTSQRGHDGAQLTHKAVKVKEAAAIINSLKNNKSPGYDLITTKMLKEAPAKATRFITILANAIFRTGHFPQIWKCAEVTLLQKPGKNPKTPSSYKPISLLPIISKLIEKIIHGRLLEEVTTKQLIPNH